MLQSRIQRAEEHDDSATFTKLLHMRYMSCNTLQSLLDRNAAAGNIAITDVLVDMMDDRGCPPNLNSAAIHAVENGKTGEVLVLLAKGANNYENLIHIAEMRGYHDMAHYISTKGDQMM